jgi:hypothetical protein
MFPAGWATLQRIVAMTIATLQASWPPVAIRTDRIASTPIKTAQSSRLDREPDQSGHNAATGHPAPRAEPARIRGDKPPVADLHFPDPLPELPKIDPAPAKADYHQILPILRGK